MTYLLLVAVALLVVWGINAADSLSEDIDTVDERRRWSVRDAHLSCKRRVSELEARVKVLEALLDQPKEDPMARVKALELKVQDLTSWLYCEESNARATDLRLAARLDTAQRDSRVLSARLDGVERNLPEPPTPRRSWFSLDWLRRR